MHSTSAYQYFRLTIIIPIQYILYYINVSKPKNTKLCITIVRFKFKLYSSITLLMFENTN